ncbi:MAG: hypothetical protein B7Z80_08250 [Rhodospirillales bacterium 20-64-7]|nr:MAG: hypothetical protein B7Z80_08250 [Rhodospirillales bacterium 20-64-7]
MSGLRSAAGDIPSFIRLGSSLLELHRGRFHRDARLRIAPRRAAGQQTDTPKDDKPACSKPRIGSHWH